MDKLAAYLSTVSRFDWATFNCCHFVAGWLVANGEPDPMRGIEVGGIRMARRIERELGGAFRAVSDLLGREPITAALAGVGDIMHFQIGEGFTLGICNGTQSVCIDEAGGTAFLPTLEASCAWRLKP